MLRTHPITGPSLPLLSQIVRSDPATIGGGFGGAGVSLIVCCIRRRRQSGIARRLAQPRSSGNEPFPFLAGGSATILEFEAFIPADAFSQETEVQAPVDEPVGFGPWPDGSRQVTPVSPFGPLP